MKDQLLKARTHRRYQNKKVDIEIVRNIIKGAKNSPSAFNMQLSRYIIVNEDMELKDKLFKLTNLPTFHEVEEQHKPAGYIIVVVEKSRIKNRDTLSFDQGIVYQSINLMMNEYGMRNVCLFSPNKNKIQELLKLGINKYEVSYAIGYGHPLTKKRNVVETEDISAWKYFKDESGIYNVPKLTLETLIIDEK
ncbi:nitroreductase family protein [Psychrilyobacter atlanticus]|uniref:nitroreductase family protein n=1 Tax=Psychrilyobacter atlanticus TaxID=271091 RepID=UPI0004292F70|nr:nitroreductase family protein [Psychrilyobacter atlanticus]